MITPLDAGVVVAGLLLAFVGAAVSVYAVSLTGFLIGAGAGYLAVPTLSGQEPRTRAEIGRAHV